jgi:hypothetical protein
VIAVFRNSCHSGSVVLGTTSIACALKHLQLCERPLAHETAAIMHCGLVVWLLVQSLCWYDLIRRECMTNTANAQHTLPMQLVNVQPASQK